MDPVTNTLAYRLEELICFMRNTNVHTLHELAMLQNDDEKTVWGYFVDNCYGTEAEEWIDENGDPVLEWDRIWHK